MKHTILFFKRIGLAYLLYSVLRFLFLCFSFKDFIQEYFWDVVAAFYYGLIFDSSAIVYTFSLFIFFSILPFPFRNRIWYQGFLKVLFILSSTIAIVLSSIDLEFAKFKGKRSGIDLISVVGDEGNSVGTYFRDFWYLMIVILVLLYAVYRYYPKLKEKVKTTIWKETIAFALIVVVCVFGARGGTGLKPIKSFAAANYVEPGLVQLTLNTPFNFISTAEGVVLEEVDFLPMDEAREIVGSAKKYSIKKKYKKRNVVLLILESFGREYVGHLGGEKASTPFLDSLSKREDCLSMRNFYSDGNVSMDAVPSIMSGIPNWMDVSFTNSIYQTNSLENIGAMLGEMGYSSKFYHGSKNGTMGFKNFLSMGGMEGYNGIDEYPNVDRDHDGNWGIYDGPYLQHIAEELKKEKKPFFTSVFTLSSHHPYPIPKELKDSFSHYPTKARRSVAYTDYAVKQFFESIKKEKWFKNTLFLITADHSSFSRNKYYTGAPGRYDLPLLVYTPGRKTVLSDSTYSHKDILPSILDYSQYRDSFYSLGNSFFDTSSASEIILYSGGLFWIKGSGDKWLTMRKSGRYNSYFLQAKGSRKRKYLKKDAEKEVLLKKLRAYIQSFNNDVIHNSMSY